MQQFDQSQAYINKPKPFHNPINALMWRIHAAKTFKASHVYWWNKIYKMKYKEDTLTVCPKVSAISAYDWKLAKFLEKFIPK